MNSKRIILNVIAAYSTDGAVIPMYIIWRSGKVSKITTVLDVRSDTNKIKFTCQLQNEAIEVWMEEGQWFLNID